jgi:ABC-type nitrate/sulfonate/bicarbonate transport system substrate-binding protein
VNLLHVGSTIPCAAILLYVAAQQGIFARYGLEVRLVFVPGTEIPELSAATPFGFIGAPAALLRAAGGAELKILGCFNTSRASGRLIATPAITRPAGLSGARLGVRALGAGQWIQTLHALESLGLDLDRDRIRIVPVGDEAQITRALESGEIEAAIFTQTRAHALKSRGFSDLLDLYPADIRGFPSAVVATADQLRRSADEAAKLMESLIATMAFCLAPRNRSLVMAGLLQASDTKDPAAAREGYREFLLTARRKPYPCMQRLLQMQRVMARSDPRVLELSIQDLVDDQLVRHLDESGSIDRLYANS